MERIKKSSPVIALTIVILASYGLIAGLGYLMKNPPEKKYFTPNDFVVPLPKEQYEFKQRQKVNHLKQFDEWFEMRTVLYNVKGSYEYIEYEYIGYYFVTAYAPEECGFDGSNFPKGWTTASDTICHYSDDWKTPTTCAIDRNYHGFGEYLLIGDPYSKNTADKKIYVTEDTGAFRGKWIDVFRPNYADMAAFPTGYFPVYSVTFRTETIYEKGWLYKYGIFRGDLSNSGFDSGFVYGCSS